MGQMMEEGARVMDKQVEEQAWTMDKWIEENKVVVNELTRVKREIEGMKGRMEQAEKEPGPPLWLKDCVLVAP